MVAPTPLLLLLSLCLLSLSFGFSIDSFLDSSAANDASSSFSSEFFDRSTSSANADTKVWAVLVAGSNTWWNYRHQADICHAYHILRSHGIPAENIITLMYDDIANSPQNPYKGKIYNDPTSMKDQYEGVAIDYRGEDVNPANFMAILTGDKPAVKGGNGRVLESIQQDKVFVYFADHGGVGLICFPGDEEPVLSVKDLTKTLKQMHDKKMFGEMVFYLEACESGSMFAGVLPNNLNIYALTAANPSESSWGCYCDNTLKLPCLGDLFSVNWMQDSDKENLLREKLETQFDIVKKLTTKSHVQRYGDSSIWKEPVSEFQGDEQQQPASPYYFSRLGRSNERPVRVESPHNSTQWPTRDIPLLQLIAQRERAQMENGGGEEVASLTHQIHVLQKKRRFLEAEVKLIVKKAVHDENTRTRVLTQYPAQLKKIDCHHSVMHAFSRVCFNFNKNPYALKYTFVLANLCELGIETDRLVSIIFDHCADLANINGIM